MSVEPSFVEALFYISLIIAAPIFLKLARISTRYILNRYVTTDEIVVVYMRRGTVVATKKIKTTGYVVDQLKALKGGA